MKKLLFLSTLLFSMLVCVAFVSCSKDDDDDDKGKSSPLLGAWKMTDMLGGIQKYYYFGQNGKAAEINVSFDTHKQYKGYFFNVREYSVTGNKLLIDDSSVTFSLKDKTLILSFGIDEMEFKAVDYNEVKEYIDGVPQLLAGVWLQSDIEVGGVGNSIQYMILNDDFSADELEVYFDEYGIYQKSYVYHGKWSFSNLIFNLDTKGFSKKCLVSVDNVTGKELSYHYYDKNHNNKELGFYRWDMNDIQYYLDNATKK